MCRQFEKLKNITANNIYIVNSKKIKTKKFFKTIEDITGRAALIFLVPIAAKHLSNFKF